MYLQLISIASSLLFILTLSGCSTPPINTTDDYKTPSTSLIPLARPPKITTVYIATPAPPSAPPVISIVNVDVIKYTYIVSGGMISSDTLLSETMIEAEKVCKRLNKTMLLISVKQSYVLYIIGKSPKVTLVFSCG